LGTDILNRIDGFWFGGDNSWFSIDDAIAQTPGRGGAVTAPTPFINAWGVLEGTDGNDTLFDTFATNGLYGGEGNDFLFGSLLNYSQAEYDGSADDYTFTQNANGSVRVTSAQYGVDTLNNIDGIWFRGEARWSSVEDLIETTGGNDTGGNGGGTGTVIGGVITGRNDVNDRLEGTNANDTFYAGRGDDAINGGGGRDTLRVDGDITEWTFDLQNNGTLIMTHPTWGENIVTGVEQLFSIRAGRNYTIDQALQLTDRLPEFRLDADNVLNGTNGNDNMVGANAGTNFIIWLYLGANGASFLTRLSGCVIPPFIIMTSRGTGPLKLGQPRKYGRCQILRRLRAAKDDVGFGHFSFITLFLVPYWCECGERHGARYISRFR